MKETLSKIPVARRQLHSAIALFFTRQDPVAIHTVAAAAHQILYDLASAQGYHGLVRRPEIVRPEKLREWNDQLNVPQNFFKHADRDPETTIEFDPKIVEVFLLDAIVLLQALGVELSLREQMYSVWFSVKNPNLLVESEYRSRIEGGLASGIDPEDRESVWELLRIWESEAQQDA